MRKVKQIGIFGAVAIFCISFLTNVDEVQADVAYCPGDGVTCKITMPNGEPHPDSGEKGKDRGAIEITHQ